MNILDSLTNLSLTSDTVPELNPVWKVVSNFRCPVIGSCLSVEEQRKILKKSGYLVKKMTAYEVHHMLMGHLTDENPVSVKTDRYIRHKHKTVIETHKGLNTAELEKAWDDTFRHGNVEGVFYVIATRSDVSSAFLARAFGDIHMLGHTNMTDILNARRALDVELDVNKKLASRLNAEKNKCKALNTLNKKQSQTIKQLETEFSALEKKRAARPDNDAVYTNLALENETLRQQLESMKTTLKTMEQETRHLERDKRKLEIKLFEVQATNELLTGELRELSLAVANPDTVPCAGECDPEACGDCSSCPKRILMVGGITKMKPFYRDLIEAKGGELVYHDGYMKKGSKQLKEMVNGADLVLCPVNCNSHNACLRIKKLCKKFNKPIKMLSGSSLNMVSAALSQEQAETPVPGRSC